MGMEKVWYAGRAEKKLFGVWCQGVEAAMNITSQRTLARAAGISHGHLAQVYGCQRKLTPETVEAIAKVLEEWGASCTASAKAIRVAIERTKS